MRLLKLLSTQHSMPSVGRAESVEERFFAVVSPCFCCRSLWAAARDAVDGDIASGPGLGSC